MATGLEVYDSVGTLVSRVTDRLTKLISTGNVEVSIGGSVFVGVPGVTSANDQYYVTCSHGNIAVVGNNGFTLYQTGEYTGTVSYSVFRW